VESLNNDNNTAQIQHNPMTAWFSKCWFIHLYGCTCLLSFTKIARSKNDFLSIHNNLILNQFRDSNAYVVLEIIFQTKKQIKRTWH